MSEEEEEEDAMSGEQKEERMDAAENSQQVGDYIYNSFELYFVCV